MKVHRGDFSAEAPTGDSAGLTFFVLVLLLLILPAGAATTYRISLSSLGGGSMSTGSLYSVSGTVGPADSSPMHSDTFTIIGTVEPGTIVLPDAFYAGINFQDATQALADFNGNGLPNLMEFALGNDPNSSSDGSGFPVVSVNIVGVDQFLTIQFKRRTNADALGLQYLPEVSTDGASWYSDAANVLETEAVAADAEFDWVTVRDQTPLPTGTPRFIRLRVIKD
jgi:hypothetical protein